MAEGRQAVVAVPLAGKRAFANGTLLN